MKSKLLKSESRKGYYVFDYTIQPDRQPERHLVVRGRPDRDASRRNRVVTDSISSTHTHIQPSTDHLRAGTWGGLGDLHHLVPLGPVRGAGARLHQDHQLLQDRQHLKRMAEKHFGLLCEQVRVRLGRQASHVGGRRSGRGAGLDASAQPLCLPAAAGCNQNSSHYTNSGS